MQSFKKLCGKELMDEYGFVRIGNISLSDPAIFTVTIDLQVAIQWEKALYIFMCADQIVRVGSSKGKLGKRMKQWQRDVSNALRRLNGLDAAKTVTPDWEARAWSEILTMHGGGEIYAREATVVTTPVGSFGAYMDEESVLINRHKPPMNRHKNR